LFNALNSWLKRVVIGPREYTVYADGRMERGGADAGEPVAISAENFKKVFGQGATLDGANFFVPGNLLWELFTSTPFDWLVAGRQRGLIGEFKTIKGELAATAEFAWNRLGIRRSIIWVYFCLVMMALDILSGIIGIVQGTLTGEDAIIIGIVLASFFALMFLPRIITELREKMMNDKRRPVIAKLSALVQHEGARAKP